jgi:hypothetical protein
LTLKVNFYNFQTVINPAVLGWENYKVPTPYFLGTSLWACITCLATSGDGGLVEVKSVQAGTHRVIHGFFITPPNKLQGFLLAI